MTLENEEGGHETGEGWDPREPPSALTCLPIVTRLQKAASCGDEEATRSMLLAGAVGVDAQFTSSGHTNEAAALYLAAEGGHLAVVIALLGAGADVNGTADIHEDDGGHPPGMSLNLPDGGWQMSTPLSYAALHGHATVAQALLDAGALRNPLSPVQTRLLWGPHTPLFLAVGEGHLDMVRVLVTAGANTNLEAHGICSPMYTPLFIAAREGHAAIVTVLLEAGADVNHQDFEDTAAIHATSDTAVLEALLHAGADPDLVGYFDVGGCNTPLGLQTSMCVRRGNTFRAKAAVANIHLLLHHGADVDKPTGDEDGDIVPPIAIAWNAVRDGRCDDVLSVLLDAGADPNPVVRSVIQEGRADILRLLLRAGADKNARDHYQVGATPLHIACRATQVACVRELLEWGANVDLRENRCQPCWPTYRWASSRYLGHADDAGRESGNVAYPSRAEDECKVCHGLGVSPADVVGLQYFDVFNENFGNAIGAHLIDRSKDEDEDDVRDALAYDHRSCSAVGSPQLLRAVEAVRDRNAIRRALRAAKAWWRRRGVMLLKARLAHETVTPLAAGGACSVGCDEIGSVGNEASLLGYWVRYRERVCARNAVRPPSSVRVTVWPSVWAGFLLALDREEGVFRNVVMFL